MADYVEKWGDDIDSAVELALRDIKLTRDQVIIEVLEQPTKGFLGFHKKLAKVRVSRKPEPKPEPIVQEKPKKEAAPVKEKKQENRNPKKFEKRFERAEVISDEETKEQPRKEHKERNESREGRRREKSRRTPKEPLMKTKFTVTDDDAEAVSADDAPAVIFIKNIAEKMDITIDVKGNIIDDVLYIEMSGREVGTLIGKRGQTLDSVQYLASIVQNKGSEKHMRVLVNAESYREKREKTLQQLARKIAEKCVKTGRNQKLEPMNPYERKVIHSALQSHPKVTTRSEGVEPTRRVVIELKR